MDKAKEIDRCKDAAQESSRSRGRDRLHPRAQRHAVDGRPDGLRVANETAAKTSMKDYEDKSKMTEASLQLNKIGKNAKRMFVESSASFRSRKAPLTPATDCCKGPNGKCPVDRDGLDHRAVEDVRVLDRRAAPLSLLVREHRRQVVHGDRRRRPRLQRQAGDVHAERHGRRVGQRRRSTSSRNRHAVELPHVVIRVLADEPALHDLRGGARSLW